MAQRTAFLNSDAKGFNKDFHHTWIENYMIKQPGVLFSNYSTKPEFALGNGQIAGGKAIIRCTRTTGTFAGEEILASFESTTTENISTSGNKKVFIEIPEVYVNDSTSITDTLTQGVNLGVGRIVSDTDFPSHSNYIPLWEITGGDWQNATDLRPEVLRRGKPNTISYFGGNGEEERIDIDNASLNKYLMSNGAGVAPSWEEGGGGGGGGAVENFKRTFTADETLLAKSMFGVETLPTLNDIDTYVTIGNGESDVVAFNTVLNGEDFSSITLNLKAVNSPADSLTVRIETLDDDGFASGTLIDVGATGTVTPTGTAANMTVNLGGTITGLAAHTKVAVVLQRTGTASSSNYFQVGAKVVDNSYALGVVVFQTGSAWAYRGTTGAYAKGCVSCDGFADEALVQATTLNKVTPIGYCETGVLAGNDFTGILDGTVDYPGATSGTKYYLIWNGTLSDTGNKQIGKGLEGGVLQFTGIASGQSVYDAIVATDGSGDYTTLYAAMTAGKRNIYIKAGTYNETPVSIVDDSFTITGANPETVVLNYTIVAAAYQVGGACITFSTSTKTNTTDIINHTITGVTFNIIETGSSDNLSGYLINANSVSANPKYMINIDNCNIKVLQTGASIRYYDIRCTNKTISTISNSYISVHSEDNNTGYYANSGNGTQYLACEIMVYTSSNNSVYASCMQDHGNFYFCNITCKTSGTGNSSLGLSHAYGCEVSVIGTSNKTAGFTLNNSANCSVKVTKPHTDLNGLTKNTEVSTREESTQYAIGDWVLYSSSLYVCNTAHTSTSNFYDDNSKWTYLSGSSMSGVEKCTISGGGILFAKGKHLNCNIDCSQLLVIGNEGLNSAGPKITGTTVSLGTGFVKLIGGCIMLSGNTVKSRVGVYYQDLYHIIKDNYLTSDVSSSQELTLIGTNNNYSKVSDNLIRYR